MILESMRETTLNWYQYYLNHPEGDDSVIQYKKLVTEKIYPAKQRNMLRLVKSINNIKRSASTDMYLSK